MTETIATPPAPATEAAPAAAPQLTLTPLPLWRRVAPIAATAVVAALVPSLLVWWLTRPNPPRVSRLAVPTSTVTALTVGGASATDRDLAISPDSLRIVYLGGTLGARQLFVRALDQIEPTSINGLGNPRGLFFSPDGQWIGFGDGNSALKKVAISGGPAVTLCPVDGAPGGATWSGDTIVFATNSPLTGLQRVSEAGGEPTVLTKPNIERREGDHLWPEFLPGGQAVLFSITPPVASGLLLIDSSQVAVLDLRTGMQKTLIRGGFHAHYVPSGHLNLWCGWHTVGCPLRPRAT